MVPIFLALLSLAQDPKPLPTIEVTAPKEAETVLALNTALSTFSEKVTACNKAGDTPESCQCRYPNELRTLRMRYDAVLKLHPEWKDQLLSYHYVNKEGRNISGTMVMSNLRRQLEILKCG